MGRFTYLNTINSKLIPCCHQFLQPLNECWNPQWYISISDVFRKRVRNNYVTFSPRKTHTIEIKSIQYSTPWLLTTGPHESFSFLPWLCAIIASVATPFFRLDERTRKDRTTAVESFSMPHEFVSTINTPFARTWTRLFILFRARIGFRSPQLINELQTRLATVSECPGLVPCYTFTTFSIGGELSLSFLAQFPTILRSDSVELWLSSGLEHSDNSRLILNLWIIAKMLQILCSSAIILTKGN